MSIELPKRTVISNAFMALQDDICKALEDLDGEGTFQEDAWKMATGGGGRTRVIQGSAIEKGGVNFSSVEGPASDSLKKILKEDGDSFYATGLSIVLHPSNPWVPIIHMNIRYFEMGPDVWWFGGGIDLTPHYINQEEAAFFHQSLKEVCDQTDAGYYDRFKKWADDYFFIRHRDETRGIGGIFFDRLNSKGEGKTKGQLFEFVCQIGRSFLPVYSQLFRSNFSRQYSQEEKSWQLYRRGRYVEFNLVWDRGTRFGLETGGRTESILMSLPTEANWKYNYQPEPDSRESKTLSLLKKGVDWLNQGFLIL